MEEKILKALQEKGAMRPGDIAAATADHKEEAAKKKNNDAKDGKFNSHNRCFYDIQK